MPIRQAAAGSHNASKARVAALEDEEHHGIPECGAGNTDAKLYLLQIWALLCRHTGSESANQNLGGLWLESVFNTTRLTSNEQSCIDTRIDQKDFETLYHCLDPKGAKSLLSLSISLSPSLSLSLSPSLSLALALFSHRFYFSRRKCCREQ
jgi:hypothetical protein